MSDRTTSYRSCEVSPKNPPTGCQLIFSGYEVTFHKRTTHNLHKKGTAARMTIRPDPFYDRKLELAALDRGWKRHGASGQMLLLYGRRRLGKTFLLQHYFTAGEMGMGTKSHTATF
jgi:hypothetical protein